MQEMLKNVVPVRVRQLVKDVAQMAAYGLPSPVQGPLRLSQKAQGWFEALRTDGIVKIENDPDFERVAGYIDEQYFLPIEKEPGKFLGSREPSFPFGDRERFIQDINEARFVAGGTEISCSVSFMDAACSPLYLNADLADLLCKYYGRQPYYRNQPLIQKVSLKGGQLPLGNGHFHVDHLHQISVMLLISDVSETETHMEFCQGSHRRHLLREGIEIPFQRCEPRASEYPIIKCTGRKGTLFVFDTSGFHRANYIPNSTRKILHLNITTGHNLGTFIDRKTSADALKASNRVKRMFQYLKTA